MDYQIIATLGPASRQPETWAQMLAAGATGFRLNTSHLTLAELDAWLGRLGPFLHAQDPLPTLTLDLQGSKWRLGALPAAMLETGQIVRLVPGEASRLPLILPVPHADFFAAAGSSSGEIVVNDAKVRLQVERIEAAAITARVTLGGEVQARKGITFSASDFRQERLNEKDQQIVSRTGGLAFVRYAVSYVKDAVEMAAYREKFGPAAYLVAKLERGPAVAQAGEIATAADELWLCRGDLGAELGLAGMAESAFNFTRRVSGLGKPALLAGQVLEHMVHSPTPTRSEVYTLYDALQQGYAGCVLSDETAVGEHPIEACRVAAMFR